MKSAKLILRCYAENKGNNWQVFCLDLTLAAQGETFLDAKQKLEEMICSYVYDAVAGDDSEYAEQLLNRSAPMSFWLKYYYYVLLAKVGAIKNDVQRLFHETLPLTPVCHN